MLYSDLANTYKRLMEKYQKGIISSEEMACLNTIEDEIDTIIKLRNEMRRK